MKLVPWLVVFSFVLVSCSGSKSAQKVNEDTPQVELSDADEYIDNLADEPSQTAEAEASNPDAQVVTDTPVIEEPTSVENEMSPALETVPVVSEMTSPPAGSEQEYVVQKNETLMLIAFKLYGDYQKWKDIASHNQNVLKGNVNVRAGTKLKYLAPAEEFVWNPQGLPYLIRTGDTLGTISKTVYTTPKKWKLIWDNNRPLIRDPNKIFAGFTLYYLENGREVAAEL